MEKGTHALRANSPTFNALLPLECAAAVTTFKTLLLFALGGALSGGVVASLIAPRLLSWYNTPGFASPSDCSPVFPLAFAALIRSQTIGALIGLVVTLILGVILMVRGR